MSSRLNGLSGGGALWEQAGHLGWVSKGSILLVAPPSLPQLQTSEALPCCVLPAMMFSHAKSIVG